MRDQDADRLYARKERHVEASRGAETSSHVLVHLRILEERVDPLAPTPLEHVSRLRVPFEGADLCKVGSAIAVGSGDSQLISGRKRDGYDAGSDQLTQPAHDQVEQRAELELADERSTDLVQGFELPRPGGGRFVEARVLDRDCGLGRKQRDELFVILCEVVAAIFLGEIEISVGHSAQQDRDAEKRVHRWVAGRKTHRTWVL